jgi:hypothetical protein
MPTNTPDDEPVTCRVCGKPFAPGEPRYRDEEGDVHPECYKRPRRPPEAVIGSHRPSTTGLTVAILPKTRPRRSPSRPANPQSECARPDGVQDG